SASPSWRWCGSSRPSSSAHRSAPRWACSSPTARCPASPSPYTSSRTPPPPSPRRCSSPAARSSASRSTGRSPSGTSTAGAASSSCSGSWAAAVTESAERRFDRGAFFDVDGTLVSTNVVDAYAYYVFHRGTIFGTAQRLIRGLAMAPIYAIADRVNRKVFNELFYRAYRGLSEDRLIELSQDLCDKVLKPAVYPGALDIIAECRKAGC